MSMMLVNVTEQAPRKSRYPRGACVIIYDFKVSVQFGHKHNFLKTYNPLWLSVILELALQGVLLSVNYKMWKN